MHPALRSHRPLIMGRRGAIAVPLVALENVGQHQRLIRHLAARQGLQRPAVVLGAQRVELSGVSVGGLTPVAVKCANRLTKCQQTWFAAAKGYRGQTPKRNTWV